MFFDQTEFGKRIRALRMAKKLTQQQVADELNLSYEHYKKIEKGVHGCSIGFLLDASAFFGVSTDYLLKGESFCSANAREKILEAKKTLQEVLNELEK